MERSYKLPVNIYWDGTPSQEKHVKDVLPVEAYHSPGKIINSAKVIVEGKPWLNHDVSEKKKKAPKHELRKANIGKLLVEQTSEKGHLKSKDKSLEPGTATLRDLRKEEKQKVANLIKELAKFGEEKENAVGMLGEVKEEFSHKLKKLEEEKQKAIRKQDRLKEKILEYEIQRKESNAVLKDKNGVKDKLLSPPYLQSAPGNVKPIGENKENLPLDYPKLENDVFTEVFLQQQIKFEQQQEVLQQQIEQLQKLQESIVIQQQKQQQQQWSMNILNDDDTFNNKNLNATSVSHKSLSDSIGENSLRLNDYIQQTTKKPKHLHNMEMSTQTPHQTILVTNTFDEPELNRSAMVNHATTFRTVALKSDYAVQTEDLSSEKSIESDRLEQCEKSITLLEQSLNYVSSLTSKLEEVAAKKKGLIHGSSANADSLTEASTNNPDECNVSKMLSHYGSGNTDKFKLTSKSEVRQSMAGLLNPKSSTFRRLKYSQNKQSNSRHLIHSLLDESSSSDIDDISKSVSRSVIRPPSSAVKRRNFQPSSIIDLADGLQPRSTSTSVDQYSLRTNNQSSRILRQSHVHRNEKETLKKIYEKQNTRKHEIHFNDELEEQNIIDDVFFIK